MCVSCKEMTLTRKLNYLGPLLTLNSLSREVTLSSLGEFEEMCKEREC